MPYARSALPGCLVCLSAACAAQQTPIAPPPSAAPVAVELPPLSATALTPPQTADAEVLVSVEGRSQTRRGPCAPDPDPPRERVFSCTSSPEWPRREWSFEGDGRVIDVLGAHALVMRTHTLHPSVQVDGAGVTRRDGSELRSSAMALFEIDRARWLPLELIEPTAEWLRAGFTRDGELLGLVRTGRGADARVWIAHGPTGSVISMMPLDRAADDVARTEAGDYLITSGDRVFWVSGEGQAVRRVTLPAGLSLAANAQSGVGQTGQRVRCERGRCVVDGRAIVSLLADRSIP